MSQSLHILHNSSFCHEQHQSIWSNTSFRNQLCISYNVPMFCSSGGTRGYCLPQFKVLARQVLHHTEGNHFGNEAIICQNDDSNLLQVQCLRNFPREKLNGEIVLVRFDSNLLLKLPACNSQPASRAIYTVKYLYRAGARVLLASNWSRSNDPSSSTKSVADCLSSVLQLKVVPVNGISDFNQFKMEKLAEAEIFLLDNLTQFKHESANGSEFAQKLSQGVGIFVNDAFSLSHKVLASTVGVARFCYTSVAGFHFEDELIHLMKSAQTTRRPYVAIIGGGNFSEKKAALHLLASKCDGLVFVGNIAFQIMHALGLSVPLRLVELGAIGDVLELIQLSHKRNIPILFPKDFSCVNDCFPEMMEIFPAEGFLSGWSPVDLGPISLKEIHSFLLNCKKILWIGPLKFGELKRDTSGASELARMLEGISRIGCEVIVVGNAACKEAANAEVSCSSHKHFHNASAVWDFLKGRTLPGVAALDKAYPFDIAWDSIFCHPTQPLVVDIGSGNGLFLLKMAGRWTNFNFLGLEINKKLVRRCLDHVSWSGINNLYFLSTNATHTFRSIVSSYPGELVLVSIQCPNPDFNKEEHRWRMIQRTLIEAIVDLLSANGKVFLQSDIEEVAARMKEQFLVHGKDILVVDGDNSREWIKENPFGFTSDWEQHVLDRGVAMYRVMLRKIGGNTENNIDDLCTFP